jgi:plasmid stability protein
MSRTQLHVRIPLDEKEELREEAARHGISMSALVRIDIIQARENRARQALKRQAYPQRVYDDAIV